MTSPSVRKSPTGRSGLARPKAAATAARLGPTRCDRDFAHTILRAFVVAQTEIRGLADAARVSPFREAHLRDESRRDEMCTARYAGSDERTRVVRERREQSTEPIELSLGESRADLAGVTKCAVLVAVAEQQRADTARTPSFARRPTADHELLPELVFDLAPRR